MQGSHRLQQKTEQKAKQRQSKAKKGEIQQCSVSMVANDRHYMEAGGEVKDYCTYNYFSERKLFGG